MAKKHKDVDWDLTPTLDVSTLVVDGLEVEIEQPAKEPQKLYDTADWKGVRTVFRCAKCGTCRDDEDSMILHVLVHFPKDEQDQIFNQLVKKEK